MKILKSSRFFFLLWLDLGFDVIVGNIVKMWGMLKSNNDKINDLDSSPHSPSPLRQAPVWYTSGLPLIHLTSVTHLEIQDQMIQGAQYISWSQVCLSTSSPELHDHQV